VEDAEVIDLVLSASSVNSYLDCHLRWYFEYVLMEPSEPSEEMRVGIATHAYAESKLRELVDAPMERHEPAEARDVQALDPVLACFDTEILPTFREPLLIEAGFSIKVNGISYTGIIDYLDRQDVPPLPEVDWDSEGRSLIAPPFPAYANILRDLKTTRSRPARGKYRFNMIGYHQGVTIALERRVDAMQLDYIVRTKTPYYWPEVVALPDEDDIAWFTSIVERVAAGIESGDYAPTGLGTRACSWCPYKTVCGPYARYLEVTDGR
jgi:hypothetical protein